MHTLLDVAGICSHICKIEATSRSRKPPDNGLVKLLKKLYYDLQNPDACAGRSKLLQEANKHEASIPIEDIEEWLKLQLEYTLDKPIRLDFKTRQVVVHQIDKQWLIDLVDMSKISKHNDGFKFVMVGD